MSAKDYAQYTKENRMYFNQYSNSCMNKYLSGNIENFIYYYQDNSQYYQDNSQNSMNDNTYTNNYSCYKSYDCGYDYNCCNYLGYDVEVCSNKYEENSCPKEYPENCCSMQCYQLPKNDCTDSEIIKSEAMFSVLRHRVCTTENVEFTLIDIKGRLIKCNSDCCEISLTPGHVYHVSLKLRILANPGTKEVGGSLFLDETEIPYSKILVPVSRDSITTFSDSMNVKVDSSKTFNVKYLSDGVNKEEILDGSLRINEIVRK